MPIMVPVSKPQLVRAGQGGQLTFRDKPVGWPCRQPAGHLELSKQAGWSVPGAWAGDMETALSGGGSGVQMLHSEQP